MKIVNWVIGCLGLAVIGYAIYLGLWVCFIGGIVDLINQIKADETSSGTVAWGILKIVCAGTITVIVSLIGGIIAGFGFFGGAKEVFGKKRKR